MTTSAAAVERTFVGLPSPVVDRAGAGGHPCQGIYHVPAGSRPTTAFIATHYNVDFSEHYLAPYLAERGFGFLGWNTRFRGAEAYFLLDHALAEIAVGVRWLREQGVERVVLLGNSGGGSLMGAYHSQSVEPNIRPARDRTVLPAALDLAPADLFVFVAAHPGRPEILTDWMDPSVLDEADPLSRDPSLDPFEPGPPYDADFVARYRAAQRDRNARITAWCHAELDRLATAGHPGGDRLFTMSRTWADLRMMDGTLDPSDRRTPWCYGGDPARANAGVFGIGTVSTCRSWLNMWSLTDSDCRAAPHLARLHLPTLIVHASADNGVFPAQARELLDAVAAGDKQLVTVTGDHYFRDPPGAGGAPLGLGGRSSNPLTRGGSMSDDSALADRFFAAIEAGDIATVREIYAPDAEIWHNTDGLVQGPDDNVRTLGWIAANLRDLRYTRVKRSATDDGFVQQHVLVATNRAGDRVEVPACIVTTVRDGRIVRLDEYLDSATVASIMAR